MTLRSGIAALLPLGLLAAALPASAALLYDGGVPIYPNADIAGSGGQPNSPKFTKALQHGFALMADTKDSPRTVIAWYRSHLPGSYTLHTEAAGSQFKGGGNIVNVVVYKGRTRIVIVPGGP
jgi:hypothetical protein